MNIAEILLIKYPDAFPDKIILQDDGEGIYIARWLLEGVPKPTKAKLAQWAIDLEDDFYNNNQKKLREKAYLPLSEQLDMQYWDKENGTNNWAEHITAVKEQYPLRNVD